MPHEVVKHESEHLYADPPRLEAGSDIVKAVQRLQQVNFAEDERTRIDTELGGVDLLAVRYLLQAEREHVELTPKDLAAMLGVATATVTKVVDRLEEAEYIERKARKGDRRSYSVIPTTKSRERVTRTFGRTHEVTVRIIDELNEADAALVAGFLHHLADEREASLADTEPGAAAPSES